MKEKKSRKNIHFIKNAIVGHSFALLPKVKCTIYLFQTTLEGNQYNNSYFWYKKLEHTIDLELVCLG